MPWPRHPAVLEVNTIVWLGEVAGGGGLGDVPASAWDELAAEGLDAVWLMGVWERSPAGRAVAMADDGLQRSFREALPGLTDDDIVGSPYCVRSYVADPCVGGPAGLAAARAALAERGLRLVLDFVPNHVAPDHPWVTEHPERFVHEDDGSLANGRDPYFPPWPDVVQLDAFDAGLRAATVDQLVAIGDQCDGVRCDMAMLVLNEVFARTWGERVGPVPERDFWPDIIAAVRAVHPGLLFAAEAYWDLEGVLLGQGFDACYDKRLHDRLIERDPAGVRWQLAASVDGGAPSPTFVRFLENHDEPRAAAMLGGDAQRAATVALATLPGATLWHEGQFEGRRVRVPVFLTRRPDEPLDGGLADFHRRVIEAAAASRVGGWRLLDAHGWPDNASCERLVAWCWDGDAGRGRTVVIVNLSGEAAQARVPLPWADLDTGGAAVRLTEVLDGTVYERDGGELAGDGLFVDLPPWSWHWLAVGPVSPAA